jgi:hypothetical protein
MIGAAGAVGIAALAAAPDEKGGEPVIFELSSLDRARGLNVPDLGIDAAVLPDTTVRAPVVAREGRPLRLPL